MNKTFSSRGRGFALLEALIAMILFVIGILGIIALQAKASQFSGDSEDRTRAALLANEIVTTMVTEKYASTSSAPSVPSSAALAAWKLRVADTSSVGLPAGVGAVSAADADGAITVSITWKSVGKKSTTASSSGSSSSSASSSASSSGATPNSIYTTKVALP